MELENMMQRTTVSLTGFAAGGHADQQREPHSE
jgi:hypothetical protein